MSFNTVGELVKALQQFDPSTPILKSDGRKAYFDINLQVCLTYWVTPMTNSVTGEIYYLDAAKPDPQAFNAVVL